MISRHFLARQKTKKSLDLNNSFGNFLCSLLIWLHLDGGSAPDTGLFVPLDEGFKAKSVPDSSQHPASGASTTDCTSEQTSAQPSTQTSTSSGNRSTNGPGTKPNNAHNKKPAKSS